MNDDLHPLDESIRTTLHGAADDLAVDPVPADALARRGRMRRMRRRALGVCGVAALSVGGVVVVTSGDDGAIQTTDEPAPTTTVQLVTGGEGDGDALVVAPAPTLPPVEDQASQDEPAAEPATVELATDDAALSSFSYGPDGLYPWGEGFLSIRIEYPPRPLPELSDEIAALFPQEVADVFPDGLPPTIDEAMDTLSEAGLLDEVSAILSEHPDAMDAVYAAEPPPPEMTLEYSEDGVTWEQLPADWPISPHQGMSVADDTLVVWAMEEQLYGEAGPSPDPDGVRTLTVHTTTDLQSWTTETVDIPMPVDPRPYVRSEVWVANVAPTADGWIAVANTNGWVDELALLPDDVRARIESGDDGYGYGFGLTPEGVQLERHDPDTDEWTVELLTWADLGIEPIDVEQVYSRTGSVVLVSTGGSVEIRPAPAELDGMHQIHAAGGRLVAVGDGTVFVTDDAVTWTELGSIPERVWIATVVPVDGGTMLVGESPVGPVGWLIDESDQLVELALPELPARYSPQSLGGTAAWVIELYEDTPANWEPVTIVIEHDGYSVEMTDRPDGQTVVATDLATGDVVYQLDQSWDDESWQEIWEWDDEAGTGWIVLRDADGGEVVRIPMEVVDLAYQEQQPAVVHEPPAEPWTPDFWLVATTDGVDWLVLDLDDPDPLGDGYWPSAAAVNGNRVLYRAADGWQLAIID